MFCPLKWKLWLSKCSDLFQDHTHLQSPGLKPRGSKFQGHSVSLQVYLKAPVTSLRGPSSPRHTSEGLCAVVGDPGVGALGEREEKGGSSPLLLEMFLLICQPRFPLTLSWNYLFFLTLSTTAQSICLPGRAAGMTPGLGWDVCGYVRRGLMLTWPPAALVST